jgi:hypothetical protein
MMVVLATACVAVGCGERSSQLRFDGVYEGEVEAQLLSGGVYHPLHNYLRFYEDGTVVAGWGENASPADMFATTAKDMSDLRGTYELSGDQVTCSLTSESGRAAAYGGTLGGETLELYFAWNIYWDVQAGHDTYHFRMAPVSQ